jgi:methylated-DNA-protein-cysteine methyltransferase related protein
MTFRAAVYALVRRVPLGQVVTYGQVAALVGRARSARAVGGAMGRCPDDVPWHRVVNAQGAIARRRQESGMLTQRIRLEQEGVRLRRGRVPLATYQWEPPRGAVRRQRARDGRGRRVVWNGRPATRGRTECGWR